MKDSHQEYSTVASDTDNDDNDYCSRAHSRPLWIRTLILTGFFSLGLLSALAILASSPSILNKGIGATELQPFRAMPIAQEGRDEQTGLPLSWSNGDCGNSLEDALARDCRYSIVLHSWLPRDCLSEEDLEDEVLLHDGRDWPYVLDNGNNMTLDLLREGDFHHFTTSFDWHVAHCMFVWKRLHRVMANADYKLDSYTANFHHTKHCVEMIAGHPEGMKDSGTKIFVKYPVCV